jgi:hypothetical protein
MKDGVVVHIHLNGGRIINSPLYIFPSSGAEKRVWVEDNDEDDYPPKKRVCFEEDNLQMGTKLARLEKEIEGLKASCKAAQINI